MPIFIILFLFFTIYYVQSIKKDASSLLKSTMHLNKILMKELVCSYFSSLSSEKSSLLFLAKM